VRYSYSVAISTNMHVPISKSQAYQMTIPQGILDELRSISGSLNIVKSVRQVFYLSTSISPLVILVPKKYHSVTNTYRKEALVAVNDLFTIFVSF
jgi:hypothetical protein